MAVFKNRHVLPGAAWVDGNNIQVTVTNMPKLARVRRFVIRAELVFQTSVAAAAAIPSTQLHRLIQMLDLGVEAARGSGPFWHFMRWQMRGAEVALPAGIPATNNSAFRRTICWMVEYEDRRAKYPLDGCPIGADFNEKVISIDTASFLALDNGTNTWNTLVGITGTVRVEAVLAPPTQKPGSRTEFGFGDLTGQAPSLTGTRLYEDLFVFRETMATVNSDQVSTIALQGDGAAYYDQIRFGELTADFNEKVAAGSNLQTPSATVPEGGEMLPEAPGVGAGAASTITAPFLPVIVAAPGHQKSDALSVESDLSATFTGTDTGLHVGFRRVIPHTDASAVNAFARVGKPHVKSLGQVASATGSKRPLSGKHVARGLARFLPLEEVK